MKIEHRISNRVIPLSIRECLMENRISVRAMSSAFLSKQYKKISTMIAEDEISIFLKKCCGVRNSGLDMAVFLTV